MGLLQTASFRGVPFKVIAAQAKKGRRQAIHEYPYVDGGWPEDMGRALRMYSFSGYLIGDLAPVMQLLLDNAVETKGPGLLIHPTIGARIAKRLRLIEPFRVANRAGSDRPGTCTQRWKS
jgi:prophage DNA circulation protein